jgi:hypothetical protein
MPPAKVLLEQLSLESHPTSPPDHIYQGKKAVAGRRKAATTAGAAARADTSAEPTDAPKPPSKK